MPSSYTPRLRLELQAAGENLNTWGAPKLNNALSRIDTAIAGRAAIVLAGAAYSLSASNGDDEARAAILDFSGTGPASVTLPSVSKIYLARNGASGVVTLTTGAGTTLALAVGDTVLAFCDGTNVVSLLIGGASIKAYVDAVRAYVDQQAWDAQAGVLPGQGGNAGRFLKTDGTSPTWAAPAVADISDYASDQSAKAQAATARAIAFSLLF
ncbi:hypothetical protein [Phenylobacterium sp.]|uniref:hypothetical protein n=1 Tax=Phenylobacterium sp. TaxID=1871053 RepID=UPI0030F42408